MRCFTPNGTVTFETCPVCREPGVEVEHGYEADVDLKGNVTTDTALHQHLWHCPECGDSLAWVVNCQACERTGEGEAARAR
jgi:predicted RNA-binding Zn-ribbon protein involved in translation (DUF1610 family)